MPYLCLTVDVEVDCSTPKNQFQAETLNSTESYSSTQKGLNALIELFEKKKIYSTLFFEARTALHLRNKFDFKKIKHEVGFHGFSHEDFTGLKTNSPPIAKEKRIELIENGLHSLEIVFDQKILGFRPPYTLTDDSLLELSKKYFSYDSTTYGGKPEIGKYSRIPISEGVDSKGKKITGYLWKLMEGERSLNDYKNLLKQNKNDLVVLATHSWHSHHTLQKGVLSDEESKENVDKIEELIDYALENGFEFTTIAAYLHQKLE